MAQEILTISLNGGEGKMTLYLNEFFPCYLQEIRHFYKTCVLSDWSNNAREITQILLQYCKERLESIIDPNKSHRMLDKDIEEPVKSERMLKKDIKELERLTEIYD